MKMFLQTCISFIICTLLYFTSLQNSFCYGTEGKYLSQFNSSLVEDYDKPPFFNVLNYGAKGDGVTNDAEAFLRTWDAACKSNGGVMYVPTGRTFLLQPVIFYGNSCRSKVVVQVDGKIVAPLKSQWGKNVFHWIQFTWMKLGLTIQGSGVIDGQGKSWWSSKDSGSLFRPQALGITSSSNVTVTGVKIQNAPRMHIFIDGCQDVKIFGVTLSSPGDSPNTDGIHLTHVNHVEIYNSNLACGDDCVSIQTESYDVKIHDVNCGPGHGFSIGGLSENKSQSQVSGISVYNSRVSNALTGVRIKTWPDGYGSVHNVTYSNIDMTDVQMPIVIDQNYCGGPANCPTTTKNAVSISGVTFEGIRGTYTYVSVTLDCSRYKPCYDLTLSSINLTPSASAIEGPKVDPFCSNAFGRVLTRTTPSLNTCLRAGAYNGDPAAAPAPSLATTYNERRNRHRHRHRHGRRHRRLI